MASYLWYGVLHPLMYNRAEILAIDGPEPVRAVIST